MRVLKLTMPFPPALNQLYVPTKKGILLSEKARRYKKTAAIALYEQEAQNLKIDCDLEVTIEIHQPDNRKRDADGYAKIVLDCLTASDIWLDDSQIQRLIMEKHPKTDEPRLELTITELNLKQKDI